LSELPSETVSRLLANWYAGDDKALRAAVPLVYDELRRAAQIADKEHTESRVYIGDLTHGPEAFVPHRFTPDDWYNEVNAWTKDSKAILFQSKRSERWAVFEQRLDSETPETLIAGPEHYFDSKLSAQGNLLYTARSISSPATERLMSTPEHGGTRSTLLTGDYDYACGSSPSSSCVGQN
jgi:hypothetical protein